MADQVRLTIEEDTAAPPGHARLCFAGLAPPADARFRLRRLDAEPEHLGPHGWQNSPALLEPDAVVEESGATVFQIGPAVVDRMAADAPIELAVPAAGLNLRSYWPDIAPSPGAADLSVALPGRPAVEPAAPARPAPPKPPPLPPEPVAPAPVEPPARPKPPPEPTPEPEPAHVEPPESSPPPEPTPPLPPGPEPGGRRWLPLALGLLALLLIIGGAWRLGLLPWPTGEEQPATVDEQTPEQETTDQEAPPPTEEEQPQQTEEEQPRQTEEEQPRQTEQEQPPPARDWRAELLAAANRNAAAEELFELGQGAAAAGELETALLAYEEAIRQGHGPALLEIGRWYDPAHYSAESSPFSQPNPEQAAVYYKRASEAGVEAAADALGTLCSSNTGAAWTEQSCPPTPGN